MGKSKVKQERLELSNRLGELEERYGKYDLFSDMDLTEFGQDLFEYEMQMENEDWVSSIDDCPQDLNLNGWRLRYVEDDGNIGGKCMGKKKTMLMMESYRHDGTVLLHEVIHAYEFMLEKYPQYLQYVLLRLYVKLSEKIPNLLLMLNDDTHVVFSVHTPLFMMKALDLDLRLNLPLGTIYAYGRESMFNR